jgi:hypothetical protein
LGANGTETLFDFGERHADVQAARAAYESAVANDRNTLLTAFEGVENDLSGLRILDAQSKALDNRPTGSSTCPIDTSALCSAPVSVALVVSCRDYV